MKRIFILLGAFLALQVLALWSAYHNDITTCVFSFSDLLVLIALIIQIIRTKGHTAIRSTVGILIVCWMGFMIYMAWDFFTQVD